MPDLFSFDQRPAAERDQRAAGTISERFDLLDFRKRKLKELSKGMQQKAQLIATFIHQPRLVIVDEPFSALDPVNTQMVKDLLREERARGTAHHDVHAPYEPG